MFESIIESMSAGSRYVVVIPSTGENQCFLEDPKGSRTPLTLSEQEREKLGRALDSGRIRFSGSISFGFWVTAYYYLA